MKAKILIITIIAIVLNSCETIETEMADTNVPVIECYIQPEMEIEVLLTKQLVFNSEEISDQKLDNLEILFSDNEFNYYLENIGNGLYKNAEIVIEANKEYNLSFSYDGKEVYAETLVPEKPKDYTVSATTIEVFSFDNIDFTSGSLPEMPDPITLNWSNPEGYYHMIIAECIDDDPVLINESNDMPGKSFINAPTQGSSQEIHPMTFTYYGQYRLVLYRLNSEYAALYEQLGSSSLDIVAPPSNVENGLGIFTGINSVEILIDVVAP